MSLAIITGSGGLIGSEATRFFHNKGLDIVGIDNDMRSYFFGKTASTSKTKDRLIKELKNYRHLNIDIRDDKAIFKLFKKLGKNISIVIHTAAQPSHDWAAKEPFTDFGVNATGTLNLLQAARVYCPEAVFIYTSTNKVYGDTPNFLPLVEKELRYEISEGHQYFKNGIDETMSVDQTKHSIFGASKLAADVMVQEYGRYFNMKTTVFRGGCLTGPGHAAAELHGFLAYLIKCVVEKKPYTVFGYKGKQVRDNIHSSDLVNAFWNVYSAPRVAEVYNIGGGRFSNCSMLEAIALAEKYSGNKLEYKLVDTNRIGDHIWWISDISKFMNHYPNWKMKYSIETIISEMVDAAKRRGN